MPHIDFLQDLVIIFGFSILVVLVFQRLQLPSIIGFLMAGAMVGPYGLNLIDDVEQVKFLAEVGVVMLLFTIGLEFSLAHLSRVRAFILTGGGLQVGVTILLTAVGALALGAPLGTGIFWGFILALSSTAIVLKILMDRNELDSPHGRLTLGILIFQDLIVVPMMLIAPLLSDSAGGSALAVVLTLAKSVLLLAGLLVAGLWIVPRVLYQVTRTRNREIFVIAVILICMGIAWMTSWIGLSLAIGAFIAGLVISESEYGHQALADVMPFRDSFNSLFFVSIGMLLDLRLLLNQPLLIIGMAWAVLVVKGVVAGGVVLSMGYPFRVAAMVGLSLPQVGEFSFVLAQAGQDLGLLIGERYQLFLAVSILSMLATPFLIQLGPQLSIRADSFPRLGRWLENRRAAELEPRDLPLKDHVIIAGYGFNGRNLARVLKESKIPYVIVDVHASLVRHGRAQGDPVYFGDIARAEVLRRLRINAAKILVLAVSDPFALRRAIQVARQASPDIHIVSRARYVRDLDELFRLGADEVVPEEFESSLEILAMVLTKYGVAAGQITRKQEAIRKEGYASLSRAAAEYDRAKGALPTEVEVIRHRLIAGSPAIGKSLAELGLPARTGAMVAAVIRGDETRPNPGGSFVFEPQDSIFLMGSQDQLRLAILFLDEGDRAEEDKASTPLEDDSAAESSGGDAVGRDL
ncbi:MAG: cation:proton antiporter [Nitrospirae bacterium]|nr:cation:proton antiporter [Nitrospirota bacterium]